MPFVVKDSLHSESLFLFRLGSETLLEKTIPSDMNMRYHKFEKCLWISRACTVTLLQFISGLSLSFEAGVTY